MIAGMAYTPPTLSDFRIRFPEFVDTPDERIEYFLADATARGPGQDWLDADRALGVMYLAAHGLAQSSALAGGSEVPAGVTSLRSGALSLTFDASTVQAANAGGYGSTPYGRELLNLTRQNAGGMRVTDSGVVDSGYGGYRSSLLGW